MDNRLLKASAKFLLDQGCPAGHELVVERAVLGLFFSGVKLSDGSGGLCFTPIKEIPEAVCCPSSARAMPLSGKLGGRSAASYLDDLDHSNILRRTLAIAVLNALSAGYWQRQKPEDYSLEIGVDAFDRVELPDGGKTVVVGALVPILKKLLAADAEFTVLEMDRRVLKGRELDHYAPPSDAALHVPDADLLVITGVTILNNTLESLLALARPDCRIVVVGPTASMVPDVFLAEGVTAMGGVLVTKPDDVLNLISEGGSGYHFFGRGAERIYIEKR